MKYGNHPLPIYKLRDHVKFHKVWNEKNGHAYKYYGTVKVFQKITV